MATTVGNDGTVKIGANVIAEITAWSISETGETADDTVLGDVWHSHKHTLKRWEATISCFWDETDATGQGALTIGASVTGNFYPEGAVSNDTFFSGTMTVTAIARSGTLDGIVTAEFSVLGNGTLTEATV